MIDLNEAHDKSTITGNVDTGGNPNSGPGVVITADTGTSGQFPDPGGGFATIDASHGFKAFNGVNITIPGFTWTDMVFEIQMNRQGGKKGRQRRSIRSEIKPGDLGATLIDKSESDSPDARPSSSTCWIQAGVMDDLNLFCGRAAAQRGFDEDQAFAGERAYLR